MNRKTAELELKQNAKEIDELKGTVSVSQRRLSQLERRQVELANILSPKSSSSVGVSDHAVLRYLERKFKLDVGAIRREILTADRIAAIEAGATKISVDGLSFVIRNNTVVTAIN